MMCRMRSLGVFSSSLVAVIIVCFCSRSEARYRISGGDLIRGESLLVSSGSIFELGFFSPDNASTRYLGIWYHNLLPKTVVWVAIREQKPLPGFCGGIQIGVDGNAVVECGDGEDGPPITILESSTSSNRTLELLDSGDLVLVDAQLGELWHSFDEPADTFLPGMKLNGTVKLTSWISPSNPGIGNYSFVQDQGLYLICEKPISTHWKNNEPGLFTKDALPLLVDQMLSGSTTAMAKNHGRSNVSSIISYINITISADFSNTRLVMNYSGEIQFYSLNNGGNWSKVWFAPEDPCSVYNTCGKNALCNAQGSPTCKCLDGFNPVNLADWNAGGHSEGCERDQGVSCNQRESFLNITLLRVGGAFNPADQADQARSEKACNDACLSSCNCKAYYFNNVDADRGTGKNSTKCWTWTDLDNLYQGYNSDSFNLSLRVSQVVATVDPKNSSEAPKIKKGSQRIYLVAITGLVAGIILLSCAGCILYRRRRMSERPGYHRRSEAAPVFLSGDQSERQANNLMHENEKNIDVPFYDLDSILSATDSFSDTNKLGQGGFGPVYKGMFPGGSEIAVKRLSSCSGQGIEEFLNEVVLIAKLQHRNLVRLLGYCIKGSEKILLYEYMPNRSLDAFIFDQHNCLLLDWKKRFDIILGIARGILYLHQDSRLRIIHRDLKTSNILLDEDMNPKISDFGLARIVEGKGTEASTNKVVGTYGYMSPEYALDGKFSTKSDVFSFGVVVLEIISGRKNTGFYNPHEVLNLLGYAWRLWCDNKALDMVDPTLLESSEKSGVIKCINIGLLCVQEDPNDRPSMATVVIMLGSETSPLPLPTQPAFVVRRRLSSTSSSSSVKPDTNSVNELTFTMAQGR